MINNNMLREMRQELGITQRELAAAVGVSQAHISKIEKDRVDPRLSTVNRILSVLSAEDKDRCSKIMTRGVKTVSSSDPVTLAIKVMHEHSISQIPVVKDGKPIGIISEHDIISNLHDIETKTSGQMMQELPPTVPPSMSIDTVSQILQKLPVVLVLEKGKVVGIIARSDLMRFKCK
jgi:predicted transcriptional regulator